MRASDLKLEAAALGPLVTVYCKLGQPCDALSLIDMLACSPGGLAAEEGATCAAVDALWATGVVPLQQHALRLLQKVNQPGLLRPAVAAQVSARPRCARWRQL